MSDPTDARLGASQWHTDAPSRALHSTPGAPRGVALALCGMLAVQVLLGMYVNLYAGLPPVMNGSGGPAGSIIGHFSTMFSPGRPVLMAHMMLAATWVLTLVVATSLGDRFAIGWSATGLVALLVAGYAGSRSLCSATTTWTPASWPLGSS